MSLIYNEKTREWSTVRTHARRAHTHTHTPATHWPCLIVRIPSPLAPFPRLIPSSPTLGASYLCRPMPPLAHTPLPLLLRGGTAASEQALPLRGADRALIWGPMLGKRLIKGEPMRKRQGLITPSESISTLWANWPGSEWPAAGQRLGHLMALLSHCRRVYFYALPPSSWLPFNELDLVIRWVLSELGRMCSSKPPHHHHHHCYHVRKTREAWWLFRWGGGGGWAVPELQH